MPHFKPWSTVLLAGLILPSCGDDTTAPRAAEELGVRINEFLASNQNGLTDEDGNESDWIELYNSGLVPVDLSGWSLTDDVNDLGRWVLPSVTVGQGEYVVIFASGEDRSVPAGELHTNFRLSADGEYLGLVRTDGTVESEFAPYPPQSADVSYGSLTGGSVGYLRVPTPGETNSGEAIGGLTLSPSPGVFTHPIKVRLTFGGEPEAPIHYTTDGSEPTVDSPVYDGPLVIDQTTRIRARGFEGSSEGSETSGMYTAITDSVASFSSELPVVILHAFGAVPDDGVGVRSTMTLVDNSDGGVRVADGPAFLGGARVDTRGSSSQEFPKKQYRIELQDVAGEDVSADLLGMGLGEDWILYAPGQQDPSLISNPLMQRLAGRVGLTEVAMRFVELYLNEDDAEPVAVDDYAGIYLLSETIAIDKTRVDLERLEDSDNDVPEITGGYIFSIDRPDDDELRFRNRLHWVNVVQPKLGRLSPAQRIWAEGYIREFEAALYGPQFKDPDEGYARYIDVPSWIDAHILRLVAKDRDFLEFSHYMTKDRNGKLRTDPLWDLDRALNALDGSTHEAAEVHSPSRHDPFDYGWWSRLFSDPTYMAAYRSRWVRLRRGPLSEVAIFQEIDELAAEIDLAYTREDARWGHLPQYGSRHGTLGGEIRALKRWLTRRLTYLDGVLGA